MEAAIDTGFKDKHGKVIHVDDIVQYKLGKFAKAGGGPRNLRVIKTKDKIQTVPETMSDVRYGGSNLREHDCKYLTVIRCDHIYGL